MRRTQTKIITMTFLTIILFSMEYIKAVMAQCRTGQWDCDNGECISMEERCDGTVHCRDGSDEVAGNCLGFSNCQAYAFRCTYGACINGQFRCNGYQDCADNSDELQCSDNREIELQGICTKHDVQCLHSKECISRYNICDGKSDCADGSDETVQMCAIFQCPEFAFQCGNGACISGHAKCNKTTECADYSDESWQLCGYDRPKISSQTTTNGCQVPKSDALLKIFLHPDNNTIPLGHWVNNYETIHIKCRMGTSIKGHSSLLCINGRWSASFPSCTMPCDSTSLRGLSTYYICHNSNSITVNCNSITSSTEIEVRCNAGFEKSFKDHSMLRCSTDGTFNAKRPRCKLSCGRDSSSIGLTNKGLPIKSSDVPWLAAVYQKVDAHFNYICAGTIISPSVVLTAAHCFWSEDLRSIDIPKNFRIAAGKYYRDYNEQRDSEAQFSSISEIIVSPEFSHANNNFYRDLAIVKLTNPLGFTKNISAICVETKQDIGESYVNNNIRGSVSAWGTNTDGDVTLQKVLVKTISYDRCREQNQNLRGDKFCLEYEYESQLCRGDSGAGFVRMNPYTKRFELLGIVSYADSIIMGCVQNGYTRVTNINSMTNELKETMEQFMQEDEALF